MNPFSKQKDFWESAINLRRSVRSYQDKRLTDENMQALRTFTDNLNIPFLQPVELKYFKADPTRALANNLRNPPPDNIAFIADTDLLSVASVGFVGEIVILYATGFGISTCWFGHYLLPVVERLLLLSKQPNEKSPKYGYGKGELVGKRAICITPLGYLNEEKRKILDRITEHMMSYKRKPLNERLKNGVTEDQLPKEMAHAFNLAIKAPSAANTQHWEFDISSDYKTVKIALPVGYKHLKWEHPDVCVGACAAHFWIAMQMQEVPLEVSLYAEQGRAVWEFKL